MKRSQIWIILGIILFLALVLVPTIVNIATEVMWFGSLGFEGVYWTSFFAKAVAFFGFGILTTVVLGLNFKIAKGVRSRMTAYRGQSNPLASKPVGFIIWTVIGLIGLVTGLSMADNWSLILKFLNAASFNKADPLFGQDIGFYVFTLPFLGMLRDWLFTVVIISFILTLIIYVATSIPNIGELFYRMSPQGQGYVDLTGLGGVSIKIAAGAKTHLSALVALVLLLFSYTFWLSNYYLLYSDRGVTRGASYADATVQYWSHWLMAAISILVAVIVVIAIRRGALRHVLIAGTAWVALAIVAVAIAPSVAQGVIVAPNELALETPYISYGIEGTREGFNLNNVQERTYESTGQLTYQDVVNNPETSQNIRLLDYRPLLTTYSQLQEIRTYYDFTDVDIDRYRIDDRYRQVMLSGRHLITENLPPEAQTWVNQHIKYTHGYGVVLSPVNEVTQEGLPSLLVKDIPPTATSPSIQVERPEIYFGTEPATYVFVNTSTPEFNYPQGDENIFSFYEGTGGVPAGNFLNRLLFAVRYGDPNILLSEYFTSDTKIMFHRQIQDAVTNIAPFLRYDKDPYIVIADGKLYFVQDAYTTTDAYPYSQLFGDNISYIRNSVKIVMDAYNGNLTFYVFDQNDPIIKTYERIFPTLFRPESDMPESIRSHVRYPEDLLNIQAQVYATYHMTDPQVFYNREDVWTIPVETFGDEQKPMQAYYVIMRGPNETNEEFQLILPFTPSGRDNLIGWISANSDGDNYGDILVYKFSKQQLNYGPRQIEARISQDPIISQQITLWSQSGSNVIRGNLLVIPIGKSLLYIQPLYLQSSGGGQIPELRRVIVATGNNVVMAETVDSALAQVFGQAPPDVMSPEPPDGEVAEQPGTTDAQIKSLIQSADKHYDKAQEFLQKGDWANYGKEIDAMKADLDRLVQLTQ